MATAIQFFVHGQNTSITVLNQRLEESVQDLNSREGGPSVLLKDLNDRGINQIAVGPNHLCFLLDDGSVHRVPYSLECERPWNSDGSDPHSSKPKPGYEPPLKKPHAPSVDDFSTAREHLGLNPAQVEHIQQARRAASRPPPGRQPLVQPSRRAARRLVTGPPASAPPSSSRSRSTGQPTGVVTVPLAAASAAHRASAPDASMSRRISSGAVPEELIAQVQQVLQGKSRGAVIRELLRTNLDVNTAANNLLSRDDDEMSESEELANEAYADDMLVHWMEDAADAPDAFLSRTSRLTGAVGTAYGSDRSDKANHQGNAMVLVGTKLETLRFSAPEIGEIKFVAVGVLQSELLCVCESGHLYQWRWDQEFPYYDNSTSPGVFHPKTSSLSLNSEKIRFMATCGIRASFVTVSGKLATLIDECGGIVAKKLEHPATAFVELQHEKIIDLSVCMLYSCIRVESGSLYWWGVMPLGYRHRALEKARNKSKKSKTSSGSDIQPGSTVIYKNSAFYQPGAIGFRINSYGELQCGELMDNMWDLSSIARFRLLDPKTGKTLMTENNSAKLPPDFGISDLQPTELTLPGKRTAEAAVSDDENCVTESWQIREVVILDEGGRSSMVGKVVRVIDDHAYVVFNPPEGDDTMNLNMDKPPYLKKSDLQLYKGHASTSVVKTMDCVQRVPKRLRISGGCKKVLACAPNLRNIQMVILGVSGKLSFITYNLQSGKKDVQSGFLCDAKYVLGSQDRDLKLVTGGRDAITVMLDGNSCFYPIERDCVGSLRIPHALNCSPVQSLNVYMGYLNVTGRTNTRIPCGVVAFVIRKDSLIQSILENSVEKVGAILQSPPDQLQHMVLDCSDGNRNIFHTCAAVCAPQPRKDFPRSLSSAKLETDPQPKREDGLLDLVPLPDFPDHPGSSASPEYMHHLFSRKCVSTSSIQRRIRESALAQFHLDHRPNDESVHQLCKTTKATSVIPGPPDGDGDSNDPSRIRTERGRMVLELLCGHVEVRKHFLELMSMKNSSGMTPFMYAVLIRSYEAALIMLNTTSSVIRDSYPEFGLTPVDSKTLDAIVMDFLYPPGSPPDNSPLFVLCLNDVCTFTWTGACHIQQDVWECRTCGLTGSLCCCTECARTCHRGHECRIKKSSPTAYCDCWEKCKCQSLVSGDESLRLELFSKLINMSTDLVVRPSSRGEYLIQYLVHTVGRQLGEQRFLKINRGTRHADLLSPPKFCQMALTLLLGSYEALRTALMTGYPNPRLASFSSAVQEDQFHLSYQSGTASLDKFVHVLLTKCNSDHIDAFIRTVQNAVGDLGDGQEPNMEAQEMTNRFVRSIVRVFVILTSETAQNTKGREQTSPKSLRKIRKIFRQLPLLSVVELCEAAEALISPVRLGIARPTSSFIPMNAYSENSRGSDELFNIEPLAERRRGRNRREIQTNNVSQHEDPVPFEEDFQLVYRSDSHRGRSAIPSRPVASTTARTPPTSQSGEPEEPHSAFSLATIPMADVEVANASDMDIDDEGDSDNTDSDNGEGAEFDRTVVVEQRMDQPPEANPAQDPFSDGDNEDDDNEDSDPSTGTREEDDDDEEEDEGESDGVDMDDSGSMEGDDENLYPFFMEAGGRGGGNTVYVRAAPSMSITHHARLSGNAALPSGLQWASSPAAAHRTSARTREFFPASASGMRSSYIYMDSFGLYRRPPAGGDSASPSFSSTFSNLARSYGTIVREVAEILVELREPSVRQEQISLDGNKLERLEMFVSESLKQTWNWICQIMDSTEAQLRFGYALHQSSDTAPSQNPRSQSSRDHEELRNLQSHTLPSSARKSSRDVSATASYRNDFLGYMLSLMRAHNSEHGDSLPVLDISAMKHVAFVFDALVYYLRVTSDPSNLAELRKGRGHQSLGLYLDEDEIDPEMPLPLVYEQSATIHVKSASERNRASSSAAGETGRTQSFFRRSRSMCYLGSAQPDPFNKSLSESLPLADRPQVLLPNARREELFGARLVDYSSEVPVGSPASFKSPPVRLSLTNRQEDARPWLIGDDSDDEYGDDNAHSEDAMDVDSGTPSARKRTLNTSVTQDLLLGRWRQTLDTFSRVFAEDFAGEPGSLINDIAAFPVKEAKFRKEMERLRGTQARDLIMDVQRARGDLVPESFAALNQFFSRRSNHPSAPQPCAKIKVTFRDEPGEGNGVARSFFTVLAEALLSQERLPQLDRPAPPQPQERRWMNSDTATRMRFMRSESLSSSRRTTADSEMNELNLADLRASARASWPDMAATTGRSGRNQERDRPDRDVSESLAHAISNLRPSFTASTVQRITAMLMQLDPTMIQMMLVNDELLNARIDDAAHAIQAHRSEAHGTGFVTFPALLDIGAAPTSLKTESPLKEEEKLEEKLNDDDEPLFYEPGRPGFFAARPGKSSQARLVAFRNVGRLIGLALLQGEIFPLCLTRATVKYILDRPRTWSDFAFHDPLMFETLRKLVLDIENGMVSEEIAELYLYFAVDLPSEEGGKDLELKPHGRTIPLTRDNVYDFVKLTTEMRMSRMAEKALDALRHGVHDVIPGEALEILSPEDFRLLLNGVDRAIDIQQLASWTNWQDETNDKTQDKTRFKHWFWNTVDKFSNEEKQELLYFWTGSSAMPASEAGFAPLPSVTIRPADDAHLPTANTCISRLYIPHYSSKVIMRAKLLLAIKTKNFGFV